MSEAPSWVARRPAGWSRWAVLAALELGTLALEIHGLAGMNHFPRVIADGETPLYLFFGGFGLQILVMILVIVTSLRVVRITVSDHAFRLDRHDLPRAGATVHLGAYQRFGRIHQFLRIGAAGQSWNLRTAGSSARTSALVPAPSRIDAVLSELDFQELCALLVPAAATTPFPSGFRFDLAPYRASAMSALASGKPWFLTMLALCIAGPTLGPILVGLPAGPTLLPPLTMLIACAGIAATIIGFHRPRDGLRVTLGADAITLAPTDGSAPARTASLSAVRAERFHYALFGKSDRLTNPGLRLSFPDGFRLALAIPLTQRRWSQRVPRSWAPRWTLTPDASRTLLRALHLG